MTESGKPAEPEDDGAKSDSSEWKKKFKQMDAYLAEQAKEESAPNFEDLAAEMEAADGQAQYQGDIDAEMKRLCAEGDNGKEFNLGPFAFTLRSRAKLALHGLEPNDAMDALTLVKRNCEAVLGYIGEGHEEGL